jgi:hypothetical protein
MRIHQTRTQIEADMAVSRLAAAGLHPDEVRPWPHVAFAGADIGFWVEVPAAEADAARQILTGEAAPAGQNNGSDLPRILKLAAVVVIIMVALGMVIP